MCYICYIWYIWITGYILYSWYISIATFGTICIFDTNLILNFCFYCYLWFVIFASFVTFLTFWYIWCILYNWNICFFIVKFGTFGILVCQWMILSDFPCLSGIIALFLLPFTFVTIGVFDTVGTCVQQWLINMESLTISITDTPNICYILYILYIWLIW